MNVGTEIEPSVPATVAPFVGGHTVTSAPVALRDVFDPSTGEVAYQLVECDPDDVDRAVRAARGAFLDWSQWLPAERGRVLHRIADRIRRDAPAIAHVESKDNGKPMGQARGDIETAARYFEYYAGLPDKLQGDTFPLGPDYLSYSRLEPFGVTAHILPWNAPLLQAARGIAPALAAGNTVVAKPAEDTSATCVLLGQLACECGLPPGVLNVVTGVGSVAGDALVRHPGVDKIAFTGSLATGRRVMAAAAERVLSVTLELGGKSPNIVFDDADLGAAIEGVVKGINLNAGQLCSAGSRLLVQRAIHDEVVDRIVSLQERVSLGPGVDNPDMGPLTTKTQMEKVRNYIDGAVEEGARLACGGSDSPVSVPRGGYFVRPTVVVNVTNEMTIARKEVFGPVLAVIAFDTEDQAVAIANDSEFGLVAGVWTRDIGRAVRVAARLQVGQVFVNEYFAGGVETPFGGYKRSGIGREKGIEGLRQYLQHKTVTVRV